MSYRVMVIPEDFTKDEHILKPVVEKILADVGKPNATVLVCRNPNFRGIGEAMKADRLKNEVFQRYRDFDLFILLVDRDGEPGRDDAARHVETMLKGKTVKTGGKFVAQLAWQEVEVFVLAGHDLQSEWNWQEIRSDANVKDTFFKRLVELKGTGHLPHDGRKKLMSEAIKNWKRIKSRCPEDVGNLIQRLSASTT